VARQSTADGGITVRTALRLRHGPQLSDISRLGRSGGVSLGKESSANVGLIYLHAHTHHRHGLHRTGIFAAIRRGQIPDARHRQPTSLPPTHLNATLHALSKWLLSSCVPAKPAMRPARSRPPDLDCLRATAVLIPGKSSNALPIGCGKESDC
jgi:hypothetical protein